MMNIIQDEISLENNIPMLSSKYLIGIVLASMLLIWCNTGADTIRFI